MNKLLWQVTGTDILGTTYVIWFQTASLKLLIYIGGTKK